MEYKVGDKVFFDFKECTVKEVNDVDGVREVNDGYFSIGGHNLEDYCVPFIPDNAIISQFYEMAYKTLSDRCPHLNYPDISRYFGNLWLEACKDGVVNLPENIKKVINFIVDAILIYEETRVHGVRLFRPR